MAADHAPRHLLFVDDEPSTHRLVEEALRGEDLRLTCVGDGARALHVLERGRVELLVTSLMLPVVDGVDLLRHLANRGVTIPVLVTTDREPPLALPRSPLRFIREPLQPATLAAAVRERLAGPPGGAIAIAELAQILALVRRSCTLRAQVDGVHGELSFHAGALIDARVGGVHGEAAARVLLAWRGATLRLEPLARRASTIQASLEALLPTLVESVGLSVDERVAAVAVQVASASRERQPEVSRLDPRPSQGAPTRPLPALYLVPDQPPAPAPAPVDVPAWERPAAQAAIAGLLDQALKIEGAVGVGLGVWELDHCVAVQTHEPALPTAVMRTVLSGHSRMLRATMTTMRRLGRASAVADMLIMLDAHTHVLVPLAHADGLFLDLALDRRRSTLAFARVRVGALLAGFHLDPDGSSHTGEARAPGSGPSRSERQAEARAAEAELVDVAAGAAVLAVGDLSHRAVRLRDHGPAAAAELGEVADAAGVDLEAGAVLGDDEGDAAEPDRVDVRAVAAGEADDHLVGRA